MQLERYSFGVGDRFAQQGRAQSQALVQAKAAGVNIARLPDPDEVAGWTDAEFIEAARASKANIARNATENLFERHVRPLFLESRRETG